MALTGVFWDMFPRSALFRFLLTAMLAAWTALPAPGTTGTRRFIATGPDHPTPASFRASLSELDKSPFDGAVIRPQRRLANGTEQPADLAFSREPWQPSEIEAMVADLKETKPIRARDNFLAVQARPGDVDWFDDTGWRETVDHWRLLARSAKLGGLRGLAFDPAPPGDPGSLFHYPSQSRRAEKDFAAYAKMARDRGRDIMLAVSAEFPEAVILSAGLYSEFLPLLAGEAGPASLLPTHPLGLLPAFLDGWWDAAPPKIQVIDGSSLADRRPASEADFNRSFTWLRTQAPRLAAPEHRAKLRAQFLIGQSLFPDSSLTPPKAGSPNTASADAHLAHLATAALRASDGWIRVQGQAGRWWSADLPPDDPAAAPWADLYGGVADAITRARTPAAAASRHLATASPAENRLANGDFSKEGKEGLPDAWRTWQRDDSRGTARRHPPVADANQPATATWSAATEAHFGQDLTVKPGESYAVGTRVKISGSGIGLLEVGWKDAKGQWTAPEAARLVPPEGDPDADGWYDLAAIVRVPPGASQLVFLLGARGQLTADDHARFARAIVVRL
jgi:hypothetical protein